jgi:hypothetical protein
LTLPSIETEIERARALSGGEVTLKQTDTGTTVSLPKVSHDAIATVIEFTVEGDAFEIAPMDVAAKTLDAHDND